MILGHKVSGFQDGNHTFLAVGILLWRLFVFAEFLEARIVPERIEHRIEPKQRERKRDARTKWTSAWYREQFLNCRDTAVGLSCLCWHAGEELERTRTVDRIFLERARGRGSLGQSQRGSPVTETHIGQREISHKAIIFRLFFEERFQFAARACRQLSWAAAWSPATFCAQPK